MSAGIEVEGEGVGLALGDPDGSAVGVDELGEAEGDGLADSSASAAETGPPASPTAITVTTAAPRHQDR